MRIALSLFAPPPQEFTPLSVTKSGDILTINGEVFNFTSLPDGADVPAGEVPCEWIFGPVQRVAGELHLTLRFPLASSTEPWATWPLVLEAVPDGAVDLPTTTTVSVERTPAPGGFIVKTTTRRWHQPDQVDVAFEAKPEEPSNVDA